MATTGATTDELLLMAQKMARSQISLSGTTVNQNKGVQITVTDGTATGQPIEALVDAKGLVIISAASGSYPPEAPLDVLAPGDQDGRDQ